MEQYQWNFRSACQKKITDDIDGAESARQKLRNYEINVKKKGWQVAAKGAASIVENAKETAERTNLKSLSDATQEAVRLKEKRNKKLRTTKKKHWTVSKAMWQISLCNLASKLLSQQLDAEGQRQLIDRYLDELGEA